MAAPTESVNAVFVKSECMKENAVEVSGYDFNKGINYQELLQSYSRCGFQATNFGKAIEEINKMIEKKNELLSDELLEKVNHNPIERIRSNCTIFLGFTSNMISSGIRSTLRFLAQHNLIDCIVVTAGGVEEDFIKCMAPTYLGDFHLDGRDLRKRGINRIGNLLVPNENYCKFEDWIMPIFDKMLEEQKELGTKWTPSKVIWRLGKQIDDPESVYYWCYKNKIPVFSPALTDGSIGDMLYFHTFKNPGLIIDIVEDIRLINMQALYSAHTGMLILGGGLIKHHICNANLMRNGADFSVFINTAQEYDGSDAGAKPDEAISWGKIKMTASPVKVHAEASLVFPLIVAETFARDFHTRRDKTNASQAEEDS